MNPPRISEKVPLSECAGHPRVTETNERKRMSRPPNFPPPYSVDLVFVIHAVPDAGFLPSRRRSSTSQETGSTKRTKSRLTRIRPVGPRLRIGFASPESVRIHWQPSRVSREPSWKGKSRLVDDVFFPAWCSANATTSASAPCRWRKADADLARPATSRGPPCLVRDARAPCVR